MWNGAVDEDEAPEAGCSWPVISGCGDELDDELRAWAEQTAIEILWTASGRQYGICTSTYQPCTEGIVCAPLGRENAWNLVGSRTPGWDPRADALLASVHCGSCSGDCRCTSFASIRLWHRRVRSIVEVVVDGVTLDPGLYRLHDDLLIRTDGLAWPDCQDFTVDNGEVGTWSVTYTHGRPVPIGGRVSAGILSRELAKACANAEDCQLPRRMQTVTRQGVSMSFLDPMTFLNQGQTGVYEVDLWLASVNPNRLARRARVMRADDPRRTRRRTST